jgi:large subunit ribosomal protein L22
MIVSKAQAKYVRISPRKARAVINLIRGEKVSRALMILASLNKKAKVSIEKLLRSAMSNAKRNPTVQPDDLFISKINADAGPTLKRYRAAAMGRAAMIRHRSSHLTVELSQDKARHLVKQVKAGKRPARATATGRPGKPVTKRQKSEDRKQKAKGRKA